MSVRPSVTFVYSVETNKHIFNFFSPSGSHTILVFPYQTSRQYSDGDPTPGASSAVEIKIAILDEYLATGSMTAAVRSTIATVVYCTDSHASMNLVFHSSMNDHDEEKKKQQNLFVRSSKPEAEVTYNGRLRSKYCTIAANYTDRHEAPYASL